jgi:hypothetical protein
MRYAASTCQMEQQRQTNSRMAQGGIKGSEDEMVRGVLTVSLKRESQT